MNQHAYSLDGLVLGGEVTMAGCSAGENQIVVEQQSRDGERWAEPAHRLEEQSHRQEEHDQKSSVVHLLVCFKTQI